MSGFGAHQSCSTWETVWIQWSTYFWMYILHSHILFKAFSAGQTGSSGCLIFDIMKTVTRYDDKAMHLYKSLYKSSEKTRMKTLTEAKLRRKSICKNTTLFAVPTLLLVWIKHEKFQVSIVNQNSWESWTLVSKSYRQLEEGGWKFREA